MQEFKPTSLSQQKVSAYLKLIQDNDNLWKSVLVFLGALFLIGSFNFYPLIIVFILALACGAIAYKFPPLGTGMSVVFTVPAVAYQSAIFGWIFLLVLAIVFFEMFENWSIISSLEILVFAPFAFNQFQYFGWISILGMVIAALHFGSKKSVAISIPAVMTILFLSSIWLVKNSAYMPLNFDKYSPSLSVLTISKEAIDLKSIPTAFNEIFAHMTSKSVIYSVGDVMGYTANNLLKILISDSGILQLIIWTITLYAISSISGHIRNRRSQLISSAFVMIAPAGYYILSGMFGYQFKFEFVYACLSSVAVIGVLEQFNFNISKEVEISAKEKMKAFGRFGVQDLAFGATEKSLEDIGNYEDVKKELKDAIVTPLENKELSYTYGLKPPTGILLFGPPGTGKTMLIRALAKEIRYRFYYIKCSDLLSEWYGETERNISELFANARKIAPCVLFFDELDSIGKKRSSYSSDDTSPRVLSVILQEMDGYKTTKKPIIIIGATNAPNQIDAALLRPGRLDKIIYMYLPNKESRKLIFSVHLKKVPSATDIDLEKVSAKSERFSGADIKNAVDEAVKLASQEASVKGVVVPVNMNHLLSVLKSLKPSTNFAQLEDFEKFKMDFERRVGAVEEKKEESVKWSDVAGLDKVKTSLLETIELPLIREDLMKEYKVKPAKGLLLFGPPGTGKTLIVKAASGELNASFQSISGADLMKSGYTQAVSIIKETFNRARENSPGIVFIDEIETIASKRGLGSDEIIGQLLTEMDGLKESKGVVVIGATNKPDSLDSAILRPGRFDKIFYIPPPDARGRAEILKIHLDQLGEGVDLKKLAAITEGFSGADLASIAQEVKMQAVRSRIAGKEVSIKMQDIISVIEGRKPSITKSMLKAYKSFLDDYGERQ